MVILDCVHKSHLKGQRVPKSKKLAILDSKKLQGIPRTNEISNSGGVKKGGGYQPEIEESQKM